MKNQNAPIRKIITFINNPDADGGGFWLPNIQRQFVWEEDQICMLFDSILREYPISTLLVWKTAAKLRRRRFIENWRTKLPLSHEPEDSKPKCLVLDGQQRLQSLFIGLRGSYEGRELYFNVLSGFDSPDPSGAKYQFNFIEPRRARFPWVKFKELVFSNKRHREAIATIEADCGRALSSDERGRLDENLESINLAFVSGERITYQELDGVDRPDTYTVDDVVEIFIRANDGGTKLEKSDLLFSLLTASWEEADKKMVELLEQLNRHGFEFTKDFVLKTCLVLLRQGAAYSVEKFRRESIREAVRQQWDDISGSILAMHDFLRSKTFIQSDRGLPSYLSLIPLIFVRHHFPDSWQRAVGAERFLVQGLLTGAFSGQSDRILDALVAKFNEARGFDAEIARKVISDQQRSLQISADRFLQMGYGSKTIHLIFNLWYRDFAHDPAYDNNLPQVDHIFPRSVLSKALKPGTNSRYEKDEINQLANCMLLTRAENGAGGKRDIPPSAWFKDKPPAYLDMHLIPRDPALWALERYPEFIEARKALIIEKFADLILTQQGTAPNSATS